MRQILALATLMTSILPADAGGCRVVKHVAAVEAVVPVVPVTAIVVQVPTYTYAYQPATYVAPAYTPPQQVYQAPVTAVNVAPPAQAVQAVAEVCDCNTLLAELRALRGEIRLSAGGATSAPVQASGEAIFKQACAQCHAAVVAEMKGGGFTLVDATGKLTQLTLQEKRRIQSRVSKGQMPPVGHPALSDAQKAAVLELVK